MSFCLTHTHMIISSTGVKNLATSPLVWGAWTRARARKAGFPLRKCCSSPLSINTGKETRRKKIKKCPRLTISTVNTLTYTYYSPPSLYFSHMCLVALSGRTLGVVPESLECSKVCNVQKQLFGHFAFQAVFVYEAHFYKWHIRWSESSYKVELLSSGPHCDDRGVYLKKNNKMNFFNWIILINSLFFKIFDTTRLFNTIIKSP